MGQQNNTIKIGVPGFSTVPVFRGVPGCSGVFRSVPVFLVLVHALSGIWQELSPHYGGISSHRVARDGAFNNLVKYKELSIQFGTFQIQKHGSLNIEWVTPK